MERIFNIGEMADFFQIPASTLRYWEDKGVIAPHKNRENNYREYTLSDFMTISDVLFYKNLGLPLKQIRSMESITPREQQQLFSEKIRELEFRKQELELRVRKLENRVRAIEIMEELKREPFAIQDIDTDCVISFDLNEMEKLHRYIGDPYLYSRVQHSSDITKERRGLTVTEEWKTQVSQAEKLWEKENGRYAVCLMKEEIKEGFPNNLGQLLEQVQKSHKTGYVISRFLLCAQEDGVLYDFYKTYIEIVS